MATQTPKPQIQVGDVVRDMTEQEIEQHELDRATWQAEAEAVKAKAALRAAALAKLGLTADEIAALFG